MIIFDIETGPLEEEIVLSRVKPFEPPAPPEPFDPSDVKLGNMKDQAKIDAKIEAERKRREKEIADHDREVERARQEWRDKAMADAPLSAVTGRLLAIGYYATESGKTVLDIDDDEAAMLGRFWHKYHECRIQGRKMVGHNIFLFDVPFLIRRSWMLGVAMPDGLVDRRNYLDDRTFADTRRIWQLGDRQARSSLDLVSRSLGLDGKLEDVDGSQFAELLSTDRETAEKYLRRDVEISTAVAQRLGLI